MNKYLLICPVCEQKILTLSQRATVGLLQGIQCENCSNWLRLSRKTCVAGIVLAMSGLPIIIRSLIREFDISGFGGLLGDMLVISIGIGIYGLFIIYLVPLERDPRYKSVPPPASASS